MSVRISIADVRIGWTKEELNRASCVRKAQGIELAAQCFADGVRYWLHGDAE